ncbi:MAG: prenyltransferase [Deltaproteobacteria bacterium]|nr:prenyltransferase [Deltaproteobacteria bacterium]
MNLNLLSGPMRLPFLILTPACVMLGLGTAVRETGNIDVLYLLLSLIGAISSHVSVNAFNEYFDFRSGLDFSTKRTPFSGGSGTIPENPGAAKYTIVTAIISTLIILFTGLFFLSIWGAGIIPLGILGLGLIFFYTPWLTRNPYLCLVAPGLGFGPLMVMGTYFVLTGEYSLSSFFASLVPFFLVNNLLLLNQYPDTEADKGVGRRTLPVVWGKRTSSVIFSLFMAMAYISIIVGIQLGHLPKLSVIGLLTLFLGVPACIGSFRYPDDIEKLTPYLMMNVIINIATPVLVAAGMFF